MEAHNLKKIVALRHELHAHPELSGREEWTRGRLMDFLRENTSLAVTDRGGGVCAARRGTGRGIAFRADMDALPMPEAIALAHASRCDGVSHKCGHDGHCAALCGLALELETLPPGRPVLLIFQSAEETGAGGEGCASLLGEEDISEVYAFHNLSGYPEGSVIVRDGCSQCASEGMMIRLTGRPCHASEPEKGLNPSSAIAAIIHRAEELSARPRRGMMLCTVVHVRVGSPDFGISPGEGEVFVTLRAEEEAEMMELEADLREFAAALASRQGLEADVKLRDVFPETRNSARCVARIREAARRLGRNVIEMERPWRASEDFGWYTKRCPGAIFYIGNGEGYPALHTPEYDFNDRILETAADMFRALADAQA